MAMVNDQVKWRGVFQDTPANLKATVTPDGVTAQPVKQATGVRGIWPAADATRINTHNDQTGVGDNIVYTVPASKKFFLSNVRLSSKLSADSDNGVYLYARDGDDVFQYHIVNHLYFTVGHQSTHSSFIPALEVDAGWDLYLVGGAANIYSLCCISGWLEDA